MKQDDWGTIDLPRKGMWIFCPNSKRHGYMQQDPNGTIVCPTCWQPKKKRSHAK